MNLDVSLVHEHCQSDRSSSLKQPAEKLGDKSGFENVSGEPSKQEPGTVQNMQRSPLEARTTEPSSETTGTLSISDDLTSELNCGSLRPHKLGYNPESMLIGSLKQKQESGAENKLAESETQAPDLVRNELRAFSEDVTRNSAYGRVILQSESMVDRSTLDCLESQPVNEVENPTIEQLEPTVKDTVENAFLTVGQENKKPSLLLSESVVDESTLDHLEPVNEFENSTIEQLEPTVKDTVENAFLTVGQENKKPSLLLSESVVDESTLDHLESQPVNEFENSTIEQLEPTVKDTVENAFLTVGQENKKPSLLWSESMVDKSTLDHLESHPVNEFENSTIEHLEPTVKDIVENAFFTVGRENRKPSLLLDKSDDLGLNAIENASFTGGVGDKEPPLLLDKSEDLGLAPENQIKSTLGDLGLSKHSGTENPGTESFEPSEKAAFESSGQSELGDKGAPLQSKKRKSISIPPVTSSRVLRSRSKEKPETPETNNVAAEVADDAKKKRKMRKKKRMYKNPANEFSRIRSHLRYLLHRIKYEQNLIEAYSGEGWKGQSLEKIKPEKELQRAKSHILRYKLKIRDLLQRLDFSLAQGKLPESLFDSKGEIDSEDIFCAKCGSKDLPDNNDIILCDGACERGFHQFCLEPPLLKEDIPPDDEGWLCPGCDCKLDSFDLLNDFHGTKLSLVDSWEKVFPEAAAAASGKMLEDGSGLPSDESEDDDYDPDKPELDENLHGDESSSDESDYVSEADGPAASPNNEQCLGLPSEDSEDDDFDPDAPDHDEQVKPESSSSDFSSESEDLGAIFDDNTSLGEDQGQTSHDRGKLEMGRVKSQSLRDELSYLLDSNAAPVSGRRQVERLDYKRLHDESYGNVSSDSSDEDFNETAGRERRKRNSGKISGKKSPVAENGDDIESEDFNQNGSEHTPKRARKKYDVEDKNNSSTSRKSSSEAGSGNKSTGRQYKKLGEVVTQRLFESFKENQYPERPVKENLAKELGLTIQQVSKWFENARWSSRHSATMGSNVTAGAPSGHTSSLQSNQKSQNISRKTVGKDASSNEVDNQASLKANPVAKVRQNADDVGGTLDAGGQISGTPKSRKRKGKIDDQVSDQNSSHEKTLNEKSHTPTNKQVRRSSRLQSGSSKFVS